MSLMTRDYCPPSAAVLGAILNYPNRYAAIRHKLREKYFLQPFEKKIYGAMEQCASAGIEPNMNNVRLAAGMDVQQTALLLEYSTAAGLADLKISVLKLVEEYIRRELAAMRSCLIKQDDPLDQLDTIEQAAATCRRAVARMNDVKKSVQLDEYLEYLRRNADGEIGRIPTGFRLTDELLAGGFAPGDFSVLGGEPGSGKTSFLLHAGLRAAQIGIPTVLIEGEMTCAQILERLNGIHSGDPIDLIRAGKQRDEVSVPFVQDFEPLPFTIDECVERTLQNLEGKIRYHVSRPEIG